MNEDHNAIIAYAVNHPGITAFDLMDRYGALDAQQAEGLLESASLMWDELYDGYDAWNDEQNRIHEEYLDSLGIV